MITMSVVVFFKQKTAYEMRISDWSSDVCSSDLSHVLARAVGLDMVAAGWKPTVENYLGRVAKPRILMEVAEAKDDQTAGLIDHLKKGDMAREAERLLADADWLPDRKSVVEGKSVSGRVDIGGSRINKKKK